MYAAIKGKDKCEIIGVHDDKEVIEKFIEHNSNESLSLLKIKKSRYKDFPDIENRYLVRLGDQYIPYELYSTAKEVSLEAVYDMEYCRDILFRLLEERHLPEKDLKAISRTIRVISEEINLANLNMMDITTLKYIQENKNEFRERIARDI